MSATVMLTTRRAPLRIGFLGTLAACVLVFSASAAREGALQPDLSDELFTNAAIRHLRVEIADQDMKTLRAPVVRNRNQSERPSVPATVREGVTVWTNVSVHLKGSYGSFRPVDDKPALTLNFDKLADGQRFHGLQKISLNNSVQDPSFISEKVCREIYTAAGVPVPRADYATVELNGRNLGLFVLLEGWNKQFLRRYFTNVKGNFYDLGGGRDVNLPMEASFGEAPTNHAALAAAAKAMTERDPTKRLARLRETVDLNRFISLHALDVMMWNWDGYGLNRNNYRMFHDLESNRVVFFPHGVDQMFWKYNGPIMTGRSGLIAKSLLETSEGRRLYLERFTELRAKVFNERAMTNRVAELSARLQPALKKEGMFAKAQQQVAARQFCSLVLSRARDVDAQLVGAKTFAPIPLNTAVPLTNWLSRADLGAAGYSKTTNAPHALRVLANGGANLAAWSTTLWLEEGRYRVEGRVKTLGVQNGSVAGESGAGFRVWSTRKETRGASWGWFPYATGRDLQLGGLIPVLTNAPQQRLTGDHDWTPVTHEFELRQPLADVQIQCVIQTTTGAAWFDLNSLKIQRVSMNVSRSTAKGD